ncbi:hypothetical protein [Agreia sp. COWG]|uniref:hypothetical protein n=1 Tax=Agreia sp. COWG TaxID=2773266 RepID=UPI0019252088|nr:hypothetical protein [Agreia sp. COWG]CAD5998533.1 conserved protein of unknown function [Agreia sp. COWG]
MSVLLVILAIAFAVGLFFIIRSTMRYVRHSDASDDPDVGVNPRAEYLFGAGRVAAPSQPAAPARTSDPTAEPSFLSEPFPTPTSLDAVAAPIAPMEVGTVFGKPGGRNPVTRYDIPASLTLTLPELLQGRRRELVGGEEACSIVAAGRASSSEPELESAARVAALRDDVGALDAVLATSAHGAIDDAVLDQAWIYVVLNRISVSWESYPAARDVLAAAVRQFEWLDSELSSWLTILDDETDDATLDATWRRRLDEDVARRATSFAVRAE